MVRPLRPRRNDRQWTDAFQAQRHLRNLVVLADDALLTEGPGWSSHQVLLGLLTHQSMTLWRFSDAGPPVTEPTIKPPFGDDLAIGWVVANELAVDQRPFASHRFRWTDAEVIHSAWLSGNLVEVSEQDAENAAYEDLDALVAATQRGRDAVAASAAERVRADIFVTRRAYLLDRAHPLIDGVLCLAPEDALAVVGLYLRSRGDYLSMVDGHLAGALTNSPRIFFWLGSRELLPAGDDWFTGCCDLDARVVSATGDQPRDLTYLGMAVFQRIAGALQSRDDVLRAMSGRPGHEAGEQALMALDTCLVFLMGALDAAARVANRVLCPGIDDSRSGWQKTGWLNRNIRPVAPDLAALFDQDEASDTRTVLSLLRNTVHAAGLPVGPVDFGGREQTMVRLPRADEDRILAAVDRQGGQTAWGIKRIGPFELHADPAALLERLFPAVLAVLNEVLRLTPTSVEGGPISKAARSLGPEDPFSDARLVNIRWQLGL